MQYGSKEYIVYCVSIITFCGIAYFIFQHQYFVLAGLVFSPLLVIPIIGKKIISFWKKITHLISKMVNTLVLSIVFFLVFTPLAILRRTLSALRSRRAFSPKSFYTVSEKDYTGEDLLKAW